MSPISALLLNRLINDYCVYCAINGILTVILGREMGEEGWRVHLLLHHNHVKTSILMTIVSLMNIYNLFMNPKTPILYTFSHLKRPVSVITL